MQNTELSELRIEGLSFLILLKLKIFEKRKRGGKIREQSGEIIVELEDYILKHTLVGEELLPTRIKELTLTILPEKIKKEEWDNFLELLNSRLIMRSEKERKVRITT